MKTAILTIAALFVGGLSAFGLMTVSLEDISKLSAIIINTCSPACPQEATCISNECVFPEGSGSGEEPGGGGENPGTPGGEDPNCTANPDWTNTRGRITICHKNKRSRIPLRTIAVSSSSLLAHIAHGDTCGPCDEVIANNGEKDRYDDNDEKKNEDNKAKSSRFWDFFTVKQNISQE